MMVSEMVPGVIHVRYSTAKEAAKVMIRIQEFYENPKLHSRRITIGKVRQWEVEQFGSFDYYNRWTGFNVPWPVALTFFLTHKLRKVEDDLWSAIFGAWRATHSRLCYLVVTGADRSVSDLVHEMAHAAFFHSQSYRADVHTFILKRLPAKVVENSFAALRKFGYGDAQLVDELNAFCVGGMSKGFSLRQALGDDLYRELRDELRGKLRRWFEEEST